MTWSTILGIILIILAVAFSLLIIGGVIIVWIKTVRTPHICERCGYREGDPITGPPMMRTRPSRDLGEDQP